MSEVILLDADPESRMLLRTLLERDGYRVAEAHDPNHAVDVVRASKATLMLVAPDLVELYPGLIEHLSGLRDDIDVVVPSGYGSALLEGASGGEGRGELARDSLLLLAVLAEEGAKLPPMAEKLGVMVELTAVRLGFSRRQLETCGAAASLVALGPSLVQFRFGVEEGAATGGAAGGLGQDLRSALAALATLRCPYDLRPIIEAIEERWDGRGRPFGLKEKQIPIGARVVAVAREFVMQLAVGADEITASEVVRARSGTDYDPKVVEAFFRALRDESYVDRLQGGNQGARVLLADADTASLSVTEMRLSAAGFQVSTVQDGAKAFDMIANDRPDVVLADTVLPKLDGINLLLKVRRDPNLKNIPLIFLSSRTDQGLLNKAIKLGARDVLAKPINFDVLLAKLRALSSTKQEQVRAAAGSGASLSGDLAEMPLTDFFQVLAIGRKTCKVSVESPHGRAEVYFEHGTPTAAFTSNNERGREAFASLVTWPEGSFGITMGETPPERNLDRGLEAQLFGGGR
ncbi:MAG: response regulator [Planctomycetota bacterium]